MSRYVTVLTVFKDKEVLISALCETGEWSLDQIEVHNPPKFLYGYRGNERQEKANIIIRRKHIGKASNDIGFIIDDNGNYQQVISEYDLRKLGKQWVGNLKANYVFHKIKTEQETRGRKVSRTRCPNGKQRIEISGYR